jgi:hypothetical protein
VDVDRFDALTRILTGVPSRRALLGALLAGALGYGPVRPAGEILAKPGKGKGKGKAKGQAKGKAKGEGKLKGGGKKQGGNAVPSGAPAAPIVAAECILPAESCDGCCQNGQCLPGTTHDACGQLGASCQNCTAQATICTSERICGCDPAPCDGCCLGGVCRSGDQNDGCGSGGALCHACPDGYVCRHGVCCGEEGAATDIAPEMLPYVAACCEGWLHDASGTCTHDCRRAGCADGETCEACQQVSRGFLDTCSEGRCCLAAGACPCADDGPCEECCTGECAQGECAQHCSRQGCPSGSECCSSSGECFSRERTNCRDGDGRLFQCDAGLPCCQAPDGRAECGAAEAVGCAEPFMQALPVTCPEWVRQPSTSSTASLQSEPPTIWPWWRRFWFS